MFYFTQDIGGLVLATCVAPLLLLVPGLGLYRLLSRFGLDMPGYWQRIGWGIILGVAILPVFDTLAIRAMGMPGMLLLNGLLALWGMPLLRGRPRDLSVCLFLMIAIIWWVITAWAMADFDLDGRLYESLIIYDMVKHAAVVEQIARQGIPFTDPFFARDGIAGYYHYFYVWPAAIRWISGFQVPPTMAFAATAYWTGFAVVALLWRIAAEAGLIRAGRERRVLLLAILLCFVAGTDLLFMLMRYLVVHRIEPEIDSWNTEIRMLGTSTLWVPHYVMAVIAAWTGMLLCARTSVTAGHARWVLVAAAGAAFATLFGASVWIAVTIAPLLIVWGVMRLTRRDASLLVAGLIALLLSIPQLRDLLQGRAPDVFPIGFQVRPFTILFAQNNPHGQLWSFILLPLNYAAEFGVLCLGARAFYQQRQQWSEEGRVVRQLLLWSAILSFFVSSFLRSTIINNDLGWRSVLFMIVPLMLATMAAAQTIDTRRQLGWLATILLALGLLGTLWDLVGMRLIRPPQFPTLPIQLNSDKPMSYTLRTAYGWADRHLPERATLQHNPALTARALEFGMYGHHWPAVADKEAFLFGASRQAVAERMALLQPLFEQPLSSREVATRAQAARVDFLLFTRRDPVWRQAGGPPPSVRCIHRTTDLCIAPAISGARP